MLSTRRWAVTTISPIASEEAPVSVVGAAADAPSDAPPNTAAIAHESFVFIGNYPPRVVFISYAARRGLRGKPVFRIACRIIK
jgi:hypothetical protein